MKVSKELQKTVEANPRIKEVYFDENNNHFFRKHTCTVHEDNGHGASAGSKEVECLGTADGILKVKQANGVILDKKVHTKFIAIKETMSREEVLTAIPVLKELTDKEENDILSKAAEIYRKRGVAGYVDDTTKTAATPKK